MSKDKQKNENSQPRLLIEASGKSYEIKLCELSSFLEKCNDIMPSFSLQDLRDEMQHITDLVVDGAGDNIHFSEIKKPLKLLRELTFLFNDFLYEE